MTSRVAVLRREFKVNFLRKEGNEAMGMNASPGALGPSWYPVPFWYPALEP